MIVLGIETSCDETAVALLNDKKILVNLVYSQDHSKFGGVIPEVAARCHIDILPNMVKEAFSEANMSPHDIYGIGVTAGPGLAGGLLVGTSFAKGFAKHFEKPLWPINHLEAHALSNRFFCDEVHFPFLLMLMSGGHCQLVVVDNVGKYEIMGQTLDDAVGECFDKVARIIGFPYPGGAYIEKMAEDGDPFAIKFTVPMKSSNDCNFSFSGLKTACAQRAATLSSLLEKKDFCASFQHTVATHLCDKLVKCVKATGISTCVLAGGVAANKYIYGLLQASAKELGCKIIAPPAKFCTDNAMMVAWVTIEKIKMGHSPEENFPVKPQWQLDMIDK